MKYCKYLIVLTLIILMAVPASAQRRRRGAIKDPGALLSSARIALYDNPPRYEEALELCKQTLSNGPIPEAYFLQANIYGDYVTKAYDPAKKLEYITSVATNIDSLNLSCENKDVKKTYRKNCNKFVEKLDSVKVYFWRDTYNNAVEIIDRLDKEYLPDFRNAADDQKDLAEDALIAACDSSRMLFQCAFLMDPANQQPIEGIGIIYDRLKKYDSSALWFEKAHEINPENADIIQNIAYAYLQSSDWGNSIVWLKKFVEHVPDEISAYSNIAVCYNNMKEYDSAFTYNMKAIEIDTTAADSYLDVGQYYLLQSHSHSDSLKEAQQNKDADAAEKFMALRDESLDSSIVFFGKSSQYDPQNVVSLEQYGVVLLIRGKFEEAAETFSKLTELEAHRKDHWINLGDAMIQLKKFSDAIIPFEKASALDPGDVKLLETLADLYSSNKQPDKAKEARAKAEELKNL